jgi:chemotaxis protein methyltransferase CheR
MLLDEMRPQLRGLDVEIIATDLSEKVLTQAREAAYSQFEVQRGLPIKKLLAHFTQVGTRWVLSRAIADSVRFSQCNLLEDFTRLGTFDVILCRNVLIYFDALTKVRVLRNLAAQLAPDGYLLLGGAETVLGITPLLVPHRTERGLYVRAGSPDAAATIQFPRLASAGA